MNFELSEEQRMWRDAVHDFVEREVKPHAHEVDEEARFNWDAVRKMGPLGLLGLNIPEEHGGAGVDAVSAAIAMEKLGWGCGSTALAIAAHNGLGTTPIAMFGSQEQKQHHYFKRWVVEHWELVDRLALRRFVGEPLSQEAALFVMDRLEKDDWELLRCYRGNARLQSYFSSVVYNLLEDFARRKFGRVRPPLWLKKLGGIWLLLYRLLCLERFSIAEAAHLAADRYQHLDRDQIELMADRILGEIPTCGKTQYQEVSLDEQREQSLLLQ